VHIVGCGRLWVVAVIEVDFLDLEEAPAENDGLGLDLAIISE
jgi:hypothetical protein